MALDNADVTILSRMIHEYLVTVPGTRSIVYDRSGELTSQDSLSIDDFDTTITIGDIADNSVADITYQEADDRRVALDLDKRKYFAIDVPDRAVLEQPYAVMSDLSRQAGNAINDQLDTDLLAAMIATADSAFGSQSAVLTFHHSGTTETDRWNTAAARQVLIDGIIGRSVLAATNGWAGIQNQNLGQPNNWYMAIAPEIYGQILKYFILDKGFFGSGQMNDAAFARAYIGDALGFTPIINQNITGNHAAAGTNQYRMQFGIAGSTLHFAQQYAQMESLRAQEFFGYKLRGLTRYGAKVRENNRRMQLTMTFTT